MAGVIDRNSLYPQRVEWDEPRWLDRVWDRIETRTRRRLQATAWTQRRFVRAVLREQQRITDDHDTPFDDALITVRRNLRRDGLCFGHLARAFALIRLAATEIMGIAHYPVQLRGGYLIVRGFLVEMDTGEGKTLTATLAAAAAALAGDRVHVITVNDYLAERDRDEMSPLYARLGLRCGVVRESDGAAERQAAYANDIVYCTGKSLTFDYLKDRIALEDRITPVRMLLDRYAGRRDRQVLLQGLQCVVIDEADSILIDEARTPLIISGQREFAESDDGDAGDGDSQIAVLRTAMELARPLEEGVHILPGEQGVGFDLTAEGRAALAEACVDRDGPWQNQFLREEAVLQALSALHDFSRDVHYIIRDDKIQIVDEHTGRIMPDRAWERGMQQLIELKEGVPLTPPRVTLAKISFQLFFRRYLRIGGMSGTIREVASELERVYRVSVVRVPTHRRSRRRQLPGRVYRSSGKRWDGVADAIEALRRREQPVLVGTRSIQAADELSALLDLRGVPHQVLHARQDGEEAAIVARAGQRGQVTIATNMAGRGTDIKLGPGVAERNGLHVLLTELHDNRRIDRQLIGRCARQGQPGTWQMRLSLDDQLLEELPEWQRAALGVVLRLLPERGPGFWIALQMFRQAQRRIERRHKRIRGRMLDSEFKLRRSLSFSGKVE